MNALGSNKNNADFYLLEKEVNGMKRRIFGNQNLINPTRITAWKTDTRHPGKFLKAIKATIAVWAYLNDGEVRRSHIKIGANARKIFSQTEDAMLARHGIMVDLEGAWNEWLPDMMSFQLARSYGWVHEHIGDMRRVWEAQPSSNQLRILVLADLDKLASHTFTTLRML